MAEFDLQALHDEIEADPLALGYKEVGGAWKGDGVIADLINAKDYAIDQSGVEMEEIRAPVTYLAYDTLAADEQEWLRWMTSGGVVRVTADMKLQLTGRALTVNGVAGIGADNDSFWALAQRALMVAALLPLIETPGGRAEVLWGAGQIVSIINVAYAANL